MTNIQPIAPQPQQKVSPDSLFYQFSPEETKVMKECNRESFFQRSLPLSLIVGAGSYIAVNAGYLKPSLRWGPWPKVIFGGLLGYMVGKYSYQAVCAEKLMQIPNSEIGRVLRERRGKMKGDFFEGSAISPIITQGTSDSDIPPFSTDFKADMNIDIHKPMSSLDTDYRPNYDGLPTYKEDEIPLPSYSSPTTYDELRARNRQDYDRTQPIKPVYKSPPPTYSNLNTQPTWDNPSYPPTEQIRTPRPKESRNQYGDVFNER